MCNNQQIWWSYRMHCLNNISKIIQHVNSGKVRSLYYWNLHMLMYFSLWVVTILLSPTARQVMGGRMLLGMLSMRVHLVKALALFLSMTSQLVDEEAEGAESIKKLERGSPVFWFRRRRTPSRPPTTNVDLSPGRWWTE